MTYTYLQSVLDAQAVSDDSQEMKDLRDARKDIEDLIAREFSDSTPTIRYGGSKTKRTMNLEDYDLDILGYFARNDTAAGDSIEAIYKNVQKALEKQYRVEPKTTALRVYDDKRDLRIDVVPGRFIDDTKTDAYVHQKDGDKQWLRTNLDKHVSFIRESGCRPEIRLGKLWRPCVGLKVSTFALELLVIKILDGSNAQGLEDRFTLVLEELRDNANSLSVKDPANENNDLTEALSTSVRNSLSAAARSTLQTVDSNGWEAIFDDIKNTGKDARAEVHRVAVIRNEQQTQPWCC